MFARVGHISPAVSQREMWRTDDRFFGIEDRAARRRHSREAVSVICIASVLVGVGCYIAAINEVPFVSAFLFTVAVHVYHRLPVLNALRAPQAPMLVAALAIGTVFFTFTIPLAYWLEGAFSRAGVKNMERQTARLKRLQIERKTRRRNDDDFKVA